MNGTRMDIALDKTDKTRDDLVLATAVALERLIEVVTQITPELTIKTGLPPAQGRLMASIVQFGAAREGKL